jgi:hypothetical protein
LFQKKEGTIGGGLCLDCTNNLFSFIRVFRTYKAKG